MVDYSEITTSQSSSLSMWHKLEIIKIVMFEIYFKLINFKPAWFVVSLIVDLFQDDYNQF